jgi:hypothetical protein
MCIAPSLPIHNTHTTQCAYVACTLFGVTVVWCAGGPVSGVVHVLDWHFVLASKGPSHGAGMYDFYLI